MTLPGMVRARVRVRLGLGLVDRITHAGGGGYARLGHSPYHSEQKKKAKHNPNQPVGEAHAHYTP